MSSSSFRSYSKSLTWNSLRRPIVNRWLGPTCINTVRNILRLISLNRLRIQAMDLTKTVIRLFRRTYFQSVHAFQMKLGKTNNLFKDHPNRMFSGLINRWIQNQIHQMVLTQHCFGIRLDRLNNRMITKSTKLAATITCFNMILLNLRKTSNLK